MTVARHLGATGLLQRQNLAVTTFEDWLAARTQTVGECRRWTGTHTEDGYGYAHYQGRRILVHRLVWDRPTEQCPRAVS